MTYRPHLLPKVRSAGIREAADGMPCTLRIASFVPGLTCSGAENTVGCHLPVMGKGVGTKVTDMAIVFGCHVCHDILDGRNAEAHRFILENYPTAMTARMLEALIETHALLIDMEAVLVPDGEFV